MRETDKYGALSALVIDDNEHMRVLLKSLLRALGVGTIHAVASAKEAIKFLRTCLPDVLLVDWMMEGMTGIELAWHIRNSHDSLNPYIPIIMVTGHGDKETVVAARDAGVNEFLVKPVSAQALAERLSSIVDHPRPFVRTKSYFGPDRRRQNIARKRRERRQGDIEVTTPEAIEYFVSLVRAKMADGPVIRVHKLATGDR